MLHTRVDRLLKVLHLIQLLNKDFPVVLVELDDLLVPPLADPALDSVDP